MATPYSFLNSRGIRLAADHYTCDSYAVVVLVHGYTSNRRWRGRFPHIGRALNEVGIAAFAYDSSGCGESGDDSLRLDKLVQDVHDAVAEVRKLGYLRIALWGHSLGARCCITANPPGITTMVLSGAATAPMHYHWPDHYAEADLATLAATGKMTVPANDGVREWVTIEAQMLRDFAEFDQYAMLTALRCPVLIVNGNHPEDWEECALLEGNRRGAQWLPEGSRLHVVEGAQHSFVAHLGELTEVGVEWIAERLLTVLARRLGRAQRSPTLPWPPAAVGLRCALPNLRHFTAQRSRMDCKILSGWAMTMGHPYKRIHWNWITCKSAFQVEFRDDVSWNELRRG